MTQQLNRSTIPVFDRWSRTYDDGRISGFFKEMQSLVIDHMDLGADAKLLDIGCGTGWAIKHATQDRGIGLGVGIDLSQGMIEQARERYGHFPGTFYVRSDAEALPFPDNTFDAAMCTFSFHHYSSPVEALRGIKRVLKPGGAFYVLDNNRGSFGGLYALWDIYFRYTEPGHIRYLKSHELMAMFRQAGYQDIELVYKCDKMFYGKKVFGSAMLVRGVKR